MPSNLTMAVQRVSSGQIDGRRGLERLPYRNGPDAILLWASRERSLLGHCSNLGQPLEQVQDFAGCPDLPVCAPLSTGDTLSALQEVSAEQEVSTELRNACGVTKTWRISWACTRGAD